MDTQKVISLFKDKINYSLENDIKEENDKEDLISYWKTISEGFNKKNIYYDFVKDTMKNGVNNYKMLEVAVNKFVETLEDIIGIKRMNSGKELNELLLEAKKYIEEQSEIKFEDIFVKSNETYNNKFGDSEKLVKEAMNDPHLKHVIENMKD